MDSGSPNKLGITGSGSDDHERHNKKKIFDILGLPNELVAQILLKLCAREEAISKSVCEDFNLLMRSDFYKLQKARQTSSAHEEPQYFGGYLGRSRSEGWDPVAEKWITLPSLAFLNNAHAHRNHRLSSGRNEWIATVHCSCDGLVCLSLCVQHARMHKSSARTSKRLHTRYYTYVCNPLTKSYVAIDDSELGHLRELMITGDHDMSNEVMSVGEDRSGFTIVAKCNRIGKVTKLHLVKLDSTNLRAGWQRLPPCPDEVWAPLHTYHVLLNRLVYVVCVSGVNDNLRMMSLDINMDNGVWKSHDITISGHGGPGAALKWERNVDVNIKLLQVGGRVWLVQSRQNRYRTYDPRELEPANSVTNMADISICRYESEEEKFILHETRQIPMRRFLVYGDGSKSIICFMDHTGLPVVYDVMKKRWFQTNHGTCFGTPRAFAQNFCFQLGHASVT